MWWKNILTKNIFKELEMKKKVFEDFENSTICWISDNVYMVDLNKAVKLNHEIPIAFHTLKNYDLHPIM